MEDEILSQLTEEFKDELVAVALFGSQAKGCARPDSDTDILIVVRHLPDDWRKQGAIAGQLRSRFYKKLLANVECVLMSANQVTKAIEWFNPLLLSISEGYHILFDPYGFFKEHIEKIHRLLEAGRIRKISKFTWHIPELEVI